MKPQTSHCINNLEGLTEDLYYSLVGDEPYVVFSWEVEAKGQFSWENFLIDNQALTPLNPEEFLNHIGQTQSRSVKESYQNLLTLLQDNLSELTIYGYGFPQLSEDLFDGNGPIDESELDTIGVPVFIGLSAEGNWIGLAPQQTSGSPSSPELIVPNLASVGEVTTNLVEKIKSITAQITYTTSCKSWKINPVWEIAITANRDSIMEKTLLEAKFLSISAVNNHFWHIDEKIDEMEEDELMDEDLEKEIGLKDYFQSQLSHGKIYNLDYVIGGEFFAIHYILGQTNDGDWVGVITDSFTF